MLSQTQKGRLSAPCPQPCGGCHVQPPVTCAPRKGSGWSNSARGNVWVMETVDWTWHCQEVGRTGPQATARTAQLDSGGGPCPVALGPLTMLLLSPVATHGVGQWGWEQLGAVQFWGSRAWGKGEKVSGEERPRAAQVGATRSWTAESGSPLADCFHSFVGAGAGSSDRWRKRCLTKTWPEVSVSQHWP